jgi:uncharacterized protein YgiM (DUF1202 family)
MRSIRNLLLVGATAAALTIGGLSPAAAAPLPAAGTPTPTPTPSASATPSATPSPTTSTTATPSATPAPTPTASPSAAARSATTSATATPTPSATTPAATTFRNPITAKTYTISSYFGPRCIPVQGGSTYHYGVDLAAAGGTPIYAIAAGVVTATVSGTSSRAGYISVRHSIGGVQYTSIYMHIWSATTRVKVGQTVTAGQRISEVGSSGVSSGNHLHLELWQATASGSAAHNAASFLQARGVDIFKSASAVTAKPTPASCTYYTVGGVNFRTGPSTTSSVIRMLPQATAMTHTPGAISSGFIPVRVGTQSGWVSSTLVSPTKPAPAPAALPSGTFYATAALAFRATAASSGTSLGTIPKGTKVGAIQGLSASWAKVTYNGKTGWVQRSYLSTTPPAIPAGTPAPAYYASTALAFRATASTAGTSLGVIPKAAKVGSILATSASWAKVTYNGKTGWVQRASLTTTPPAVPAANPSPVYYATAALAFRATASTSGAAYPVIPRGANVGVIQATSASWAKVTHGGKTGWVQRSYLSTTAPAPVTVPAPTYYSTAALAFRATASTAGASLGVIPKSATVGPILASSASWAKVTYNGKTGWVQRSYLTTTPPGPPTYVANVALAFRATASTAGASLGVIPKGANVGTIQGTSASWAKVTYNGKTGWVQRSALTQR